MASDAPANDWATVGVKILKISLNPMGGGAAVTVYVPPATVPTVNLAQLDQLGELLNNASVPPGTYTSATLSISANPGDVTLTASADPDPGFAWTAATAVPAAQIQIQGATGATGSLTVPVTVNFVSNLVVAANANNQMDVEFDLSNPAFIVAHTQATAALTTFAVNFNGPWVHHHPIYTVASFVLRDLYGSVSSVSADDKSINITKAFPVEPPVTPETAIATTLAANIQADGTNGTLFYNLDATPVVPVTILNFSSVATLLTAGESVRVTTRYQADGTLVAVRAYASSTFNNVFLSPEGRVLHVNTTTNLLTVANEVGGSVPMQVTGATQFYFRTPGTAMSDATAIGTGTAFLLNVFRGFKVHATVNPLTTPATALVVDIETARFSGSVTAATTTGFDYTRVFTTVTDDYTALPLSFISNTAANGNNPSTGAAVTGFEWWNLAYPTLVTNSVTDTSAATTITDFDTAVSGSVNFGGTVGALTAYANSSAVWAPGTPGSWTIPYAILTPSPVPLGSVLGPWVSGSTGGSFTMVAPPLGVTTAVTVDVTSTAGSATLVYLVNRVSNIVTITPEDITTSAGLSAVSNAMVATTLVKVAGVPEANGHIKAYIILYYTGTAPIS
jgi:hypothetical protein